MVRTYWEPKKDGAWEFLGAFRAEHKVKDPKSPQAKGHILDVTDIPDAQAMNEKLDGRVLLVGLPTSITKHLQARVPKALPWAQLEGYVK